jgi:hypothetical protein
VQIRELHSPLQTSFPSNFNQKICKPIAKIAEQNFDFRTAAEIRIFQFVERGGGVRRKEQLHVLQKDY